MLLLIMIMSFDFIALIAAVIWWQHWLSGHDIVDKKNYSDDDDYDDDRN